MLVFRWTREFHVHKESSLVPVWVNLPNLPIHYFDKHSLFSILSPVGRPLFLDSATAAGTRPSVARVCLEIDVSKQVVPRIWVAVEGESGFWQKIVPENIPPYCSCCWRLGHLTLDCKKNLTEMEKPQPKRLQHDFQLHSNNVRYTHSNDKDPDALPLSGVIAEEGTSKGARAKSARSAQLDDEGKPLDDTVVLQIEASNENNDIRAARTSVSNTFINGKDSENVLLSDAEEDKGNTAATIEHSDRPAQPSNPGHTIVAEEYNADAGQETENLDDDAHGQPASDDGMQTLANLNAHHDYDCEGSQLVVEHNCGDVQQQIIDSKQMADTSNKLKQKAYNYISLEGEGSKAIAKQIVGGEHHHIADTTDLNNIYVELRGVEPENSTSITAHEVVLSTNAGNLSPRMVVPRDKSLDSSVHPLNIDQSVAVEKNCRQARGKGDIWVFYSSPFVCSIVGNSDQHISIHVQSMLLSSPIIMSFVHAKCSVEERRELWCNLLSDKHFSLPWCIGGDFNVILAPHEKSGGRPFAMAEGLDFMSFMEESGAFDIGFSGPSFTWSNNRRGRARISKRLDRFLINGECLDISDKISVIHLARHPSDHSPLKISFAAHSNNKPRPFRFLNLWTTKPELLQVIRQAWNQDVVGSPLRILCSKLLATRRAIQTWNKHQFGNIFDAVRSAEMAVQQAEQVVDQDDSEEFHVQLSKAQAELRHALSIEEQFWSQKARIKWLTHGDRNSRYFHAVVRQRRAQAMIHRIKKPNGAWVDMNADIADEAISYFSNLFTGSLESSSDMLNLIPPIISEDDNDKLEEFPSIEEIYRVVRSMDGDSVAGPDGFTGKFFTFAWEVVAQDVYNAILSFFCGTELSRCITSTSIVLIPKMSIPQEFSQFRPVSLCNFFNKLISRILADRVAYVLPKIISPQQTGFVKGRNISENFLLAQEIISGIGKKKRGGNVVMKLDMSKAYDRVAWDHIIGVLRRFGFGERFIDLVWRLISNVWFSVIINGSSYGFFKSSNGLRQGDPLSPALFIIGAEVLSRCLNNLVMQSGDTAVSKVFGADDKCAKKLLFGSSIIVTGETKVYSREDYVMEVKDAIIWRQDSSNQTCISIDASASAISGDYPGKERERPYGLSLSKQNIVDDYTPVRGSCPPYWSPNMCTEVLSEYLCAIGIFGINWNSSTSHSMSLAHPTDYQADLAVYGRSGSFFTLLQGSEQGG
ncbi:uncharacterized protein [Coffea arabica]|uniref:Reverse transcriptase domain-containing protein n=1 Tax=Coffea arabica TaxID=13443 RepID=A0ABM4W8G1_COFAR